MKIDSQKSLDRLAFLALGTMLWVCVAALAGLIAYAQGSSADSSRLSARRYSSRHWL